MSAPGLFDNIAHSDPYGFWTSEGFQAAHVTEVLNLNKETVSKIADVAKSSVRYDDKIPVAVRDHLIQIANTLTLVAEFFEGDLDKSYLWVTTPNPMLGNVAPRDMIRVGRGKRLLNFILNQREVGQSPEK